VDIETAKLLLDWEDLPEYDCVEEGIIDEKSRWQVYVHNTYLHKPTNTYWRIDYDAGATEYQESTGEVFVKQVTPKTKTITVYE